ncbi:hypothetical protein B1813_05545 [Saccharomonospora piscinae]|uniref:Antitoxin FitA-like ribbon-helix-helix domain-containing protein n=1 Tax=Saccharomonospora piscinae TaxID=687388 RepID=A0A1V9AA51_SACPI|nr:hypothetical protein [Saccharomonospora piscinae]OQO93973.1 hypothetical protein B1813_05545 [Saccharomonospora piscinae]
MATIQIRNLREDDYESLRRAAESEGKSLQAYMREQVGTLARRARRKALFDSARESAAESGQGEISRESILADLDAIRGPWPEGSDE